MSTADDKSALMEIRQLLNSPFMNVITQENRSEFEQVPVTLLEVLSRQASDPAKREAIKSRIESAQKEYSDGAGQERASQHIKKEYIASVDAMLRLF